MRSAVPRLPSIVVVLCALFVATGSAATGTGDGAGVAADDVLLPYDEALARGLPVPELDPNLPICPDVVADGFATPEEMEAAVDDDAKAGCQADPREGVIRFGKPLRTPSSAGGQGRIASTGYHFVGPSGTNYVRHGVRSGIEVKNPDWTNQWYNFKACRDTC